MKILTISSGFLSASALLGEIILSMGRGRCRLPERLCFYSKNYIQKVGYTGHRMRVQIMQGFSAHFLYGCWHNKFKFRPSITAEWDCYNVTSTMLTLKYLKRNSYGNYVFPICLNSLLIHQIKFCLQTQSNQSVNMRLKTFDVFSKNIFLCFLLIK